MILDASGAEQIRDAFTTAVDTTGEHAGEVTDLADALAEAADWYEGLGMTASTVARLRDAAASTAAAQASLGTAGEHLQAALGDFNARDGQVAEAVAEAGNLMRPEGYAETFTLPGAATAGAGTQTQPSPEITPGEALQALRDLEDGARWLSLSEGDPAWRPSERTPELLAQLAADDKAENGGMHGDDRTTCHTHQSWFADCVGDPSHSNPGTRDNPGSAYNWCPEHRSPVQVCRCWPATVDGRPPYTVPAGGGADEMFVFDGEDDKPAYWVTRHGQTVISQVEGQPARTVEHADLAAARGGFAEQTCDPGPGGPHAGDVIEVYWGPGTGRQLRVSTVATRGLAAGDYTVRAGPADRPGQVQQLDLTFGQYRIARRPTAPFPA
jgi:hypothetical protein